MRKFGITLTISKIMLHVAVVDQEILRGGLSFTKTPAQLELKYLEDQKKGLRQLLSHFSLTETSLATSKLLS